MDARDRHHGLKALIFDVDGTLAETEELGHRPAFNQAFADAGLDWHWSEATYGELLRVTGGKERITAWCQRVDPARARQDGFEAWVAALHAAKTAHYAAIVRSGRLTLRAGIRRLVQSARAAGMPLAIATTTTERNVRELLDAGWGQAEAAGFAVIGAGDCVPRKKPAPDIYRWVLERLALAPDQALALEDSAVGAQAALAAGLPVVVTRSRYTAQEAMPAGTCAVLDHLGEPGEPARGEVLGGSFEGLVTLDTLRAWHRAATPTPGGDVHASQIPAGGCTARDGRG